MSQPSTPPADPDHPRVALVTGAARGIGATIARRLAADGFTVAINYATSADAAELLAKEINAAGGTAAALQADVGDAAAVANLVTETTERFGPPLVLVNNAGVNMTAAVRKQDPADWDRMIAVNLKGVWLGMKYQIIQMLDQGGGTIVNDSSVAGLTGYARSSQLRA